MTVMKREIEKREGHAGFRRYLAWLAEAHDHCEITLTGVLQRNFASIWSMFSWSLWANIFQLHPFQSVYSRASKYFHSERLRRAFTFGSMYMGMSPFDAPGTYSLLQYTELTEGIWYPTGGFHAVVAALVRIGERLGVKYRLNTLVCSVTTSADGKRATGVQLSSGETLLADIVVVNADLVYAYSNLFKTRLTSKAQSSYVQSLSRREGSCSSISFYWSLSKKIPALHTHNIFLADSYRESFDAIFKRHSIPTELSFYVHVPSRIDPSASPPGTDAVVVLVPVGHILKARTHSDFHQDWPSIISCARNNVISTIESRLSLPPNSFSPLIAHEIVNSPPTWESAFNLDRGCILGLSHSFFNVLAFRPGIRHKWLDACYFVGASTHPGTGVPIVLAGAKLAAECIFQDVGSVVPGIGKVSLGRDRGIPPENGQKETDRLRGPRVWLMSRLLLALLCLFGIVVAVILGSW
jgi:phytoene desaturase (3,4-didehydrolycopene-forming)